MSAIRILFFAALLLLNPLTADAQKPEGKRPAAGSFDALKTSVKEVKNKDKGANLTTAWLKNHPLDKLQWQQQMELLPLLDGYDKVDKKKMSVRWTGKISAPVNGHYTFEQLRTYYTDGTMKLRIGGNLILESKGNGEETQNWNPNPDVNDPSFKSSPVALNAGKPVDFVLEYSHEVSGIKVRQAIPMGFPVAVLMWQSDVMERQVVPKDAFTLPTDKKGGLQAEYFADPSFTKKVGERVDSAVDFIWDKEPVFNDFSPYRQAVVKANIPRVMNNSFFTSLEESDVRHLATNGLTALLIGMTATERDILVASITEQPRVLKEIPLNDLGEQLEVAYMLPGKRHLTYLVKWSEVNEAKPILPGTYINGQGTYAEENIEPYRRIGRLFGKPYAGGLNGMIQNHLERTNGSCNLALAYIIICAGKENNSVARLLQKIDAALADKKITGDSRASWLLARAFAAEIAVPPVPRVGRGLRYLNEALGTAESSRMQYRIFKEIVVRKMSLGKRDDAKSLITSMRGQFNEPQQQEEMNAWQSHSDSLKEIYKEVQNKRKEEIAASYKNSLKRYQDDARKRNDTIQTGRIQKILDTKNTPQ